jgi:hypothetical protein
MSFLRLPLLALVLLALPAWSAAQTIPSPYRFLDTRHDAGILVGLMNENRGELDLGPGGGVFAGLRYGIELGGPFAFEASGYLLPTDRKVYNPRSDAGLEYLGDTNALLGAIDARIRFGLTGPRTWNGLAPFVHVGGGLVGDFSGRSSLEEAFEPEDRFSFGPSFLGILGGGTRWTPFDRLTFRGEWTLHIWKLGTPRAFFTLRDELASIPEQEWPGVGSFVLGASLRF